MISYIIIIILFSIIGGWLSRMCGGAPPQLKYGLDQWIFSLPYLFIPFNWFSLVSYGFAILGKRTGHGGGIDLSTSDEEPPTGRSLEKVEYLIYSWMFKRVPRYWYDYTILFLTGFVANIGAALGLMIYFDFVLGVIFLLLSSILKPVSYQIGWKLQNNNMIPNIKYLESSTAIGEFLTGFFQYIILGLIIILLIL